MSQKKKRFFKPNDPKDTRVLEFLHYSIGRGGKVGVCMVLNPVPRCPKEVRIRVAALGSKRQRDFSEITETEARSLVAKGRVAETAAPISSVGEAAAHAAADAQATASEAAAASVPDDEEE